MWFISKVFRPRTPPEAIDLVARLLEYTPVMRINTMESCAHPFFDELRQPGARLPNNRDYPPLFNFTPQGSPSLIKVLHTYMDFSLRLYYIILT